MTLIYAAAMTTLVIGTLGLAVAGGPAAIMAWRRYRAQQKRVEPVELLPLVYEPGEAVEISMGTVGKNRRLGARDRILDALRAEPDGLTCAELESRLGLSHKNASARLAEMQWAGVIVESGKRATNRGGKGAVYKVASVIQEVA